VASSCEHGNELSDSVKCWEVPERLSNCWFPEKDSAPCSWLLSYSHVFPKVTRHELHKCCSSSITAVCNVSLSSKKQHVLLHRISMSKMCQLICRLQCHFTRSREQTSGIKTIIYFMYEFTHITLLSIH
jgi:hypothetical protein